MPVLFPLTLPELTRMLKDNPEGGVLAGGTDLLARGGGGGIAGRVLIDLSGVVELRGIAVVSDAVVVGAMETMTAVSLHPVVAGAASALADAASLVGSWQIRNRATLGGNLANASPAADTPPALAALGAMVLTASDEGGRTAPAEELAVGPGQNALLPGEVIVSFSIPMSEGRVSAFVKIGSRSEVTVSRLNLAVSLTLEKNIVAGARLFMGTLGLAARRCEAAEEALLGRDLGGIAAAGGRISARAAGAPGAAGVFYADPAFLELAGSLSRALADAAGAAIPGRPTMAYKQSAAGALAQDALALVLLRLAGRGDAGRGGGRGGGD